MRNSETVKGLLLIVVACFSLGLICVGQELDGHMRLLAKGRAYLLLDSKKAYYKVRCYELPSYFCGFDTLIRQEDNSYVGKVCRLRIDKERYLFSVKSGKRTDKFRFKIASKKQQRKWDWYHNVDLMDHYKMTIQNIKWGGDTLLLNEWNNIRQQASTLDQREFAGLLEGFVLEHGF